MQQPDWRQQRSGTYCLAAHIVIWVQKRERPRDPQRVETPKVAECPGTTIIPPPPFDEGRARDSQEAPALSGRRLTPCLAGPTLKAKQSRRHWNLIHTSVQFQCLWKEWKEINHSRLRVAEHPSPRPATSPPGGSSPAQTWCQPLQQLPRHLCGPSVHACSQPPRTTSEIHLYRWS